MKLTTGFVLLLAHLIYSSTCAPIEDLKPYAMQKQTINLEDLFDRNIILPEANKVKKDVFISRGWGAAGMPFNVLYMSPYSSKAPMREAHIRLNPKKHHKPKSLPLVSWRKSKEEEKITSKPHMPQLFVSYGWGPGGK